MTFKNCGSLCCTPETYIILYINYTSIKIRKKKKESLLLLIQETGRVVVQLKEMSVGKSRFGNLEEGRKMR